MKVALLAIDSSVKAVSYMIWGRQVTPEEKILLRIEALEKENKELRINEQVILKIEELQKENERLRDELLNLNK